jgi:hypothetical protein
MASSPIDLVSVIEREGAPRALAEIIKLKRGDPSLNARNARGITPLIMATILEMEDVIRQLIHQGADVNSPDAEGNTALIHACGKKNTAIALLLINSFANVQHVGGMRRTPLMAAASQGLVVVVDEILRTITDNNPGELRSYVALQDLNGETALQIAQRKRRALPVSMDPTNTSESDTYDAIIARLSSIRGGRRRRKGTRRHKKRSRKGRRN